MKKVPKNAVIEVGRLYYLKNLNCVAIGGEDCVQVLYPFDLTTQFDQVLGMVDFDEAAGETNENYYYEGSFTITSKVE